MHLLELNNDCLLTIFRFLPLRDRLRLPLICRALRDFGAKYDLHGDQLRLSCNRHVFCSELCHQPRDLDCFSFLFTSSNPSGSFDSSPTNQSRLDKLLRLHCHLHTLCLSRFVISNRLLQIISGHCAQLRHLSLNHVTFACSSLNWLSFANQILSQLVCIEFIGCNQLVEHYVTSALKAATSLQNFAISANDIPFNGYCFEHLPRSIRSVCILDIEQFANQGTIALLSIISGKFYLNTIV